MRFPPSHEIRKRHALHALLALHESRGYTHGMKTAVSIPNDLFLAADRLARSRGKSRSQVFAEALREYLLRHQADEVTEAMNRTLDEVGPLDDGFSREAARRVIERDEW